MNKLDDKVVIGIAALLIHAAKIDEHYSVKEKAIIDTFIKTFSKNENSSTTVAEEAEKIERDSNQLLDFTNIVKKQSDEIKFKIIEQLWKIILSDKSTDQFESNLMRRICGLIYFSDKQSGEIKLKLIDSDQ
jgi:uncharacterized tellurite resistance protein B-like protein